MAQAARDQNFVPTLLAVSNADGTTPVAVYADPTTHRLLTNASGGGTVTSVSVTTANGVSGTVATATTTPAISITLGAITPTSVNGLTITSSTGTLTITNGKTLSISNTLTFTGTDSSSVAFGTGGTVAYVANKLSVFAATTSAELAGVISDETGSGALVFGTSPALTTPKVTTSINDVNAATLINIGATASAVNYIKVTNAATGTAGPIIAADGETNVDLKLAGKGTGAVHHTTGQYGDITADADGATITFNLATSNIHSVTLGGNRTLALSNEHVGQCFMLRLQQDGTGTRTVTWFTTIKWAGGVAPTLTTTINKADLLGFVVTSAGNYDGFVVGQNI